MTQTLIFQCPPSNIWIAIASVIASGPKIVLLDEPTSGQDFYHKEILPKDFRIMKDGGITVVAVTHDANFVLQHFERLVFINEGSVVAYGIAEVYFRSQRIFELDHLDISRYKGIQSLWVQNIPDPHRKEQNRLYSHENHSSCTYCDGNFSYNGIRKIIFLHRLILCFH